jgi:hypothetical protein
MWPPSLVILSAAKNLTMRPFASLRVTRECANLVWFDLGREQGISVRVVTERGKGSHATLYFGARFTIVKDRKKEIGPGLLQKMLADLGLTKADITAMR